MLKSMMFRRNKSYSSGESIRPAGNGGRPEKLGRAVEILDTIGSSMTNLNQSSGFTSGMDSRGNKISVLAFEVAKTIATGLNLFHSLSEQNVRIMKEEIFASEGVKNLVSTDTEQLLIIAAADIREQIHVFLKEVIRFGNQCIDSQWHHLDRHFGMLGVEISPFVSTGVEAERSIKKLTTLVQYTYELYHELHAWDRFEKDYVRKLEEVESSHLPPKGKSLMILRSEIKQQRKFVRSLKKKSLWSKTFEEVMKEMVDIARYLVNAIMELLGTNDLGRNTQSLGAAGLALHYANIIKQIDDIASCPTSLHPNTRHALYSWLPTSIKGALCIQLCIQEMDFANMERILQWLLPVATKTIKAHRRFGCLGEWAKNGNELGMNAAANISNLNRLETLYHADKEKTEVYILELVVQLHHLINYLRHGHRDLKAIPSDLTEDHDTKTDPVQLSQEDRDLLENMSERRSLVSGLSKSLKLVMSKKKGKVWELSRSTGNSPARGINGSTHNMRPHNSNILDVMDGLD